MKRSVALYAIIVLLLLGTAHGLYWNWGVGQIEARVADWRDAQRREGYAISYEGPKTGGYPTGFVAHFAAPRVEGPDGSRWLGPEVVGESALWSPLTLSVRFPGRHEIVPRGVRDEDDGRRVKIDLAQAGAEVRFDPDGGARHLEALLRDGKVEVGAFAIAGDVLESGVFAFSQVDLAFGPLIEAQNQAPQHIPISAVASDLELPRLPINPLGPNVRRMSLAATLSGEIEGGDPRDALAGWRDAGGYLDLGSLELDWGPLGLSGAGRLSLDDDLRPTGEVLSQVRGLNETLDALAANKLIERGVAVAAKLGIAVLPRARDAEGRETIQLPLLLRDGLLYVNFGLGQVPLLRLGAVL